MATEPASWRTQQERGTRFMLRLLIATTRLLGRRVGRFILYPITGYFLLTAAGARARSREFLTVALGRTAGWRDVARHLHTFATVVLDRIYFTLGHVPDYTMTMHRTAQEQHGTYRADRGSLLFVAHLGSFEALRLTGTGEIVETGGMRFKILFDRAQNRVITQLLEDLNPSFSENVIDIGVGGPALALRVRQALDDRYRVGVMVDRFRPGERTVTVDFLGRPARFPAAPWLMASALRARVVLAFATFAGGTRYEGHFELFDDALWIPREGREAELTACVQRYADRLAHHARRAPYNWFNFYNFWDEAAPH